MTSDNSDNNGSPEPKQKGAFRRASGATFSWLNPLSFKKKYKLTGPRQVFDDGTYILNLARKVRSKSDYDIFTSAPCPSCGQHNTLHLVLNGGSVIPPKEQIIESNGITSYNSTDTHPGIECEKCGYFSLMTDIISTEQYVILSSQFQRTATLLWWIAITIGVIGSYFSMIHHSLLTLCGIIFFTAFILIKSLSFRYRAWQYAHKRLYENNAPLKEWIEWEKKHLMS